MCGRVARRWRRRWRPTRRRARWCGGSARREARSRGARRGSQADYSKMIYVRTSAARASPSRSRPSRRRCVSRVGTRACETTNALGARGGKETPARRSWSLDGADDLRLLQHLNKKLAGGAARARGGSSTAPHVFLERRRGAAPWQCLRLRMGLRTRVRRLPRRSAPGRGSFSSRGAARRRRRLEADELAASWTTAAW